jgi:hypothetical protein
MIGATKSCVVKHNDYIPCSNINWTNIVYCRNLYTEEVTSQQISCVSHVVLRVEITTNEETWSQGCGDEIYVPNLYFKVTQDEQTQSGFSREESSNISGFFEVTDYNGYQTIGGPGQDKIKVYNRYWLSFVCQLDFKSSSADVKVFNDRTNSLIDEFVITSTGC